MKLLWNSTNAHNNFKSMSMSKAFPFFSSSFFLTLPNIREKKLKKYENPSILSKKKR